MSVLQFTTEYDIDKLTVGFLRAYSANFSTVLFAVSGRKFGFLTLLTVSLLVFNIAYLTAFRRFLRNILIGVQSATLYFLTLLAVVYVCLNKFANLFSIV